MGPPLDLSTNTRKKLSVLQETAENSLLGPSLGGFRDSLMVSAGGRSEAPKPSSSDEVKVRPHLNLKPFQVDLSPLAQF